MNVVKLTDSRIIPLLEVVAIFLQATEKKNVIWAAEELNKVNVAVRLAFE